MAIKTDIDSAAEWFAGEDKVLRFHTTADEQLQPDTSDWTVRYRILGDRDEVIVDVQCLGIADIIQASVPGTATAGRPGAYRHFLIREDAGANSVLAYGDVTLKRRPA